MSRINFKNDFKDLFAGSLFFQLVEEVIKPKFPSNDLFEGNLKIHYKNKNKNKEPE